MSDDVGVTIIITKLHMRNKHRAVLNTLVVWRLFEGGRCYAQLRDCVAPIRGWQLNGVWRLFDEIRVCLMTSTKLVLSYIIQILHQMIITLKLE